jgi:hypothetical protein
MPRRFLDLPGVARVCPTSKRYRVIEQVEQPEENEVAGEEVPELDVRSLTA